MKCKVKLLISISVKKFQINLNDAKREKCTKSVRAYIMN